VSGPELSPAARERLVGRLRAAGCVYAEAEAGVLLAAATDPAELDRLVARRVRGAPLEQVVGWADFAGVRVRMEPGVFVPRRRSELLVAEAAARAARRGPPATVVDLCCGSGAIAAAIAARVSGCALHAADIDPAAVRCARRNLAPLGARVHRGDLYAALPGHLRGRVDVLVANVPYVPTDELPLLPAEARRYEPRAALDGGPDGLALLRRVAAGARAWLAAGGTLLMETSAAQAGAAAAVLREAGLAAQVRRRPALAATVVAGRAPGRPG